MRSVVSVAVSVMAVFVLVGCTSPSEPPPGLTASATTATAGPSPTPSPTINYSDAEVGIVFEDDTDLTGAEAEVYHWAAVYETEYWRTMTTSEVSPKFSTIASPEVQARMRQLAEANAAIQLDIGGQLHVRLGEIVVDGDSARVVACVDYRDSTYTDPNGSYTPAEVGAGETTRQELTLARVAERTWIILTSTVTPAC